MVKILNDHIFVMIAVETVVMLVILIIDHKTLVMKLNYVVGLSCLNKDQFDGEHIVNI